MMPKVVTIQYDRADLEKLVLSDQAFERLDWQDPMVGGVTGEGAVLRQAGYLNREDLAGIVEATEPQAKGQSAKVVALSSKRMRVELTPKLEAKSDE